MKVLKLNNIFWSIMLLVIMTMSVFYAYISADSPYYLAISRDIANGYVPFKDIISLYAPLMMYLNSLIYFFVELPSYHIFLIFQYFVILCSIYVFYLICKRLKLDDRSSIFLCLFFFISILGSDGIYINLEVYIVLFTLLSFWFLLKKQFFWIGFFLSLGFFSKQYGILNFFPFFILVLIYHEYEKKHLLNFLIGAILPLLIFLFYYVIIENTSFISLIEQLSGKGYGQKGLSSSKSFFGLVVGFQVFLLLLIPLIILKINSLKDKIDGILIFGILVNLIPMLIQNFPHYTLLTYPYIFILFSRNFRNTNKTFLISSNLIILTICILLFVRIYRYKDVYSEQVTMAVKYKKEYPVSSEVFLLGKIRYLYILNNYYNPALSEVGYAYDFIPDEDFKEKHSVIQTK